MIEEYAGGLLMLRWGNRDMLQPSDLSRKKKGREKIDLIFSFLVGKGEDCTPQDLCGISWYYDTSVSGDKMQRGKVLCSKVVMLSMVNTRGIHIFSCRGNKLRTKTTFLCHV